VLRCCRRSPGLSATVDRYTASYCCFGAGAVLGALRCSRLVHGGQRIRGVRRGGDSWTDDAMAGFCTRWSRSPTMSWPAPPGSCSSRCMSALVKAWLPDWVRRASSHLLCWCSSGLRWQRAVGCLAARAGIQHALFCGRHRNHATTALGLVAKLRRDTDVSHGITADAGHRQRPSAELDEGPCSSPLSTASTTISRRVSRGDSRVRRVSPSGRRVPVGASIGILKTRIVYVETFLISHRAEHLRQHERSTKADREVREPVLQTVCDRSTEGPASRCG